VHVLLGRNAKDSIKVDKVDIVQSH
jgi:hypothetical protein